VNAILVFKFWGLSEVLAEVEVWINQSTNLSSGDVHHQLNGWKIRWEWKTLLNEFKECDSCGPNI
jgi:hypothetical protein